MFRLQCAQKWLCSKVLAETPKITGFLEHQDYRTSEYCPLGTDRPRLPGAQGGPDWGRISSASIPKHFKKWAREQWGSEDEDGHKSWGAQGCHSWPTPPDHSRVVIGPVRVPLLLVANSSWVWPSLAPPHVRMSGQDPKSGVS